MSALLEYVDVSCHLGTESRQILDSISLSIAAGQFVVVLGPSGAGKSTLLRLADATLRPSSGRILFQGTPVEGHNERSVQRRLGHIHQSFHLVGRSTVLRNVLCGALPRMPLWRSLLAAFPADLIERACRLLEEVGLEEELYGRSASTLSGGQKQRVAIARAFLLHPELVLADEPVASLDPKTSLEILDLLRRFAREEGCSVLCSLHQVDLARQYADRIVGLKGGRLLFDLPPTDVAPQMLQELYGLKEAAPV